MTENLKIKEVKILNDDGTSENVAIGVNASNADMKDGSNVEDRINALNNNIGKIDELESEVNACASGSPKGVYPNLQALIQANPDHNYIYITSDNGNWNYWNGSTFISGGLYQAIKNDKYEKDFIKLTGGIKTLNFNSDNTLNVETTNILIFYNGQTYSFKAFNGLIGTSECIYIDITKIYDGTQENSNLQILRGTFGKTLINNPNVKIICGNYFGKIYSDCTLQYNLKGVENIKYKKYDILPFTFYDVDNKVTFNKENNNIIIPNDLNLIIGVNFKPNKSFTLKKMTINVPEIFDVVYIDLNDFIDTDIITLDKIKVKKYYDGGYFYPDDKIVLFTRDYNGIRCNFDYKNIVNIEKSKTLWLGDSISALKDLPSEVTKIINKNIINGSFPGGCLTIGPGVWYNGISVLNITDCIKNNNFESVENSVKHFEDTGSGSASLMRKNLTSLKNMNIQEIENVVIFAGTNDFGNGLQEIGSNYDSSENTFTGSMCKLLENLYNVNKKLKITIITPIFRTNENEPNIKNLILKDYVKKEIDVANYFHLPCIDLFNISFINKLNYNQFLVSDGLHPNDYGNMNLANVISKNLLI